MLGMAYTEFIRLHTESKYETRSVSCGAGESIHPGQGQRFLKPRQKLVEMASVLLPISLSSAMKRAWPRPAAHQDLGMLYIFFCCIQSADGYNLIVSRSDEAIYLHIFRDRTRVKHLQ